MMTQTSRPTIGKASSFYELNCHSSELSSECLKKIHDFSSYIARKQIKPKQIP